ncbi:MAG: hypothetical protein AAF597_08750 [Bacteroidota bacterium]
MQLQTDLTDLITANRFDQFFKRWAETIDPQSRLNRAKNQLLADFNALKTNDITKLLREEEARRRRRELVAGLLDLVDGLSEQDLIGNAGANESPAPAEPAEESVKDLARRKLTALERALILSIDASEQFMLKEQIRELKERLGE